MGACGSRHANVICVHTKGLAVKTYNLFISHSWTYSTHYDKLVDLLDSKSRFPYKNYSVPKDDPVHNANNDQQLREAIQHHMQPCHVIIFLGGVYATYSKWMDKEIDIAKNGFTNPKSILAIKPYGNTVISSTVREAADEIVNWNTDSIVAAIRRLG